MVKISFSFILFILLFAGITLAHAQKQLIILKKEKVLLRLYPGDEIVFSKKGSKKVRKSYINNLADTAFVAHRDIVPFHTVDKIYFKRRNLLNVMGKLLVIGGVGYFLIDQVNYVLVQGNSIEVDDNVAVTSAVMVATGLPLVLMKKKYVKVGGRYRVMVAEKGSVFYRPDMRKPMDE